jgi:2-methylcitrate dehydratase PrpD
MSSFALAEVSHFIAGTGVEQLPAPVLAKARISIIDCLFACLTSSASKEATACLDIFGRGQVGPATVVGTAYCLPAGNAAYVNSVAAAGALRNDTHAASGSHPGMVVIPAVLALAEERAAEGADILGAIAVGYEVMCRLGRTLVTPSSTVIFRPTGILGPIGAAAAAARLLGLDATRAQHAISLACNTSAGLSAWADTGTDELSLHSGAAARSGIEAALMAERGVTASPTTLDGAAGLLAAFGARGRVDTLVAGLGEHFEMLSVMHKSFPACIFAQGPCQLAAEIASHPRAHADAIRRVAIQMPETAARYPGCDNPGPVKNKLAAQASVQFGVAVILASSNADAANWDNFAYPAVARIASRAEILIDRELTDAFPGRNGTRLEVHLDDGTVLTASQDSLRPMTEEEIMERFRREAEARVGIEEASIASTTFAALVSGRDVMSGLRALAKGA